MRRTIRELGDMLWTLLLTLIGQPTGHGPSRADHQSVRAKQAEMQRRAGAPASAGQVVRSALATAAQVLFNQPAPRPGRKGLGRKGSGRR